MAYCHFELCCDCGLGCFSELLLADIRRLSVVAVMFLYQITVFLQQNTTASLLELYFNESMQTVYARGGSGGSRQREVADGACSIYKHWNKWGSVPLLGFHSLEQRIFGERMLARLKFHEHYFICDVDLSGDFSCAVHSNFKMVQPNPKIGVPHI